MLIFKILCEVFIFRLQMIFLFQENQTMNLKPEHSASLDVGGVETEPQSTSFEISRDTTEVGIQ